MKTEKISLIALMTLCLTSQAQAYLDPGTGSIILQGLIAAIAAGLATGKLWWHRVKSIFSRSKDSTEVDPAPTAVKDEDAGNL